MAGRIILTLLNIVFDGALFSTKKYLNIYFFSFATKTYVVGTH